MTSFAEIFSAKYGFLGELPTFFFRFCADMSVFTLLYFLEIQSNGLLFILIQGLD